MTTDNKQGTDKVPTMPEPAWPDDDIDDDDRPDWLAIGVVLACAVVVGLALGFVMSVMHWSQDYWWPIGLAVVLAVTAWVTARWREAVVRFVLPWLALFAGVVFVCAAIGFPIWAIHQRDELSNQLSHIAMPTFTMPSFALPSSTAPTVAPDADARCINELEQHAEMAASDNGPVILAGHGVCDGDSVTDTTSRLRLVWPKVAPWQVGLFVRYARETYCPNR